MKMLGIIAEYNPFHNGHLYQITQAKKKSGADFVIAVMSPNYVQCGEPAIFDKYCRTKMALRNGIDLVIELPVIFATSSAQYFAQAAINILKATWIVDAISFGTESEDLEPLIELAHTKNEFDIKKEIQSGKSYTAAFSNYIKNNRPQLQKFLQPNNILAIEYLSAMEKINWHPQIFNVHRKSCPHDKNELADKFSSGRAIRNAIYKNIDIQDFIPKNCIDFMPKEFAHIDNASNIFHYLISQKNFTNELLGINEGLENRIIKSAQNNFLISEIVSHANSTRYTSSRIKRIILHAILGIKKDLVKSCQPQYLRILGFRKDSQVILKMLDKNLPLITNIKHISRIKNQSALEIIKKEIEATDIYFNFIRSQNFFPTNFEYQQPIVVL